MSGLIGALGTLLLSVAGPLVIRGAIALGIGTITFAGLTALMGTLTGYVVAQWGTAPAAVLQFLGLAGISQSVGIILGALTARAAMMALPKLGRLPT